MGRQLRRVPLDFNWPVNQRWKGFINPHYKNAKDCEECGGSGYSPQALILANQWYGKVPFRPEDNGGEPFTQDHPVVLKLSNRHLARSPEYYGVGDEALRRECGRLVRLYNKCWCYHLDQADVKALVEAGRLMDLTHTWTDGNGWTPKDPPFIPTAKQVNEWAISSMGHDALNQWICVRSKCARLGSPVECLICGGSGTIWSSSEAKELAENWESEDPPFGEGYQLWETFSEGSPISPVFKTPEELADWLVSSPDYTWKKNDKGTTREHLLL